MHKIVWNEIGKVLPSDRGVGDEFGISVSLDKIRLLVGAHMEDHNLAVHLIVQDAGAAYVFRRDVNDNFIQEQKLIASDQCTV